MKMRDSGKGNRGSGVSVWLGSNGRQLARLGSQIDSQYGWEIVEMAVLGIHIDGLPQWGTMATERRRTQIGSSP